MQDHKTYVLYHGNCPDGFGAAHAAWRKLGHKAEYIPVNYGQTMPGIERESTVYILDFSYPNRALKDLAIKVNKLVLIDHHKTAAADLNGLQLQLGDCHVIWFDMAHSGAYLAWKYFNAPRENELPPMLYQYLEDRDLWHFALDRSREVSQYIRLIGFSGHPSSWESLCDQMDSPDDLEFIKRRGKDLLDFQNVQVDVMCKNARIQEVGMVPMPVVNASCFFSEVGERLLELFQDYQVAGYYFDRADKRQWGLRSRLGYDCSVIAKRCGGGGHAQSSGFTEPIP